MEMLLSILVYNGILVSALSSAAKIAAVGAVYTCEVYKIEHNWKASADLSPEIMTES